MIRVFLAIELSSGIRKNLSSLQQQLKATLPPINWVRPESIHLTLKFLGYVDPSLVSQLLSALEPIGEKHAPFSVAIQGLGVFPQVKHPRIFWVGLTGNTQALQDLVFEIDVVLETMGFPPEEKTYHPHLTLARIKRENAKVGSALIRTKALESDQHLGTLVVDGFTLFQSDLDSSGARYTSLWTVPFSEISPGS
jgi:2'-5' RNA ligase